MTSPNYQASKANFSTNQQLSQKAIEDLQQKAEELFGDQKYLQSAKISAQISAACDSKEYSAEVIAKFNQVCVGDLIQQQKFKPAALVLKEILAIVENSLFKNQDDGILSENFAEHQNLRRITLNNLGCALKKSGQIDEAQFYFEQITNQDPLYELNLCAVQNQKGEHRQALIHAQQAATLLEAELKDLRAQDPEEAGDDGDYLLERTSLLAIAYYNQGCELEHMDNLIRATQAFSRAVNLQSSKHANQQLLSQFKLSLKQARFKLRQQMVPGGQANQTKMMTVTTASTPIWHNGTNFGMNDKKGFIEHQRHMSTLQNFTGDSPKFQTVVNNKKGLPKISKYQASPIQNGDPKMAMRQSHHSSKSQSELSERQNAIVDQMNQRPARKTSNRGKQANQNHSGSGPNSNSLRQKLAALKIKQADLGTGLGRSSSAAVQKPFQAQKSAQITPIKTQSYQDSLPAIVQPKSRVLSETQKVVIKPVTQVTKVHNAQLLNQKPPVSNASSKLYPNKKTDVSKALNVLIDLGLVKGSIEEQEKALNAIIRLQRWIRVYQLRKNFLKAMKNNAKKSILSTMPKNTVSKTSNKMHINNQPPRDAIKKYQGARHTHAQKYHAAKTIQDFWRKKRFVKLVHAMVIRRKVQLGYLKKDVLNQFDTSTRKMLAKLDKIHREEKIALKTHLKRQKAITVIQGWVRRWKFRRAVTLAVQKNRETKQTKLKRTIDSALGKKIAFTAKMMRTAEDNKSAIQKKTLDRSVKVLQSWIRRRRFRKAVEAMVLFTKVQKGLVSAGKLSKIDARTYQKILDANKFQKFELKVQREEEKRNKAAKLIQSLFRRRRFRNLVTIVCEILKNRRKAGKLSKNIPAVQVEKERQSALQVAFSRHRKQVEARAVQNAKRKKAIKTIQRFVRCRKFRKLVEAKLLIAKFQRGEVNERALKKLDSRARESILKLERTKANKEKRLLKSVQFLQRFIRRRKFRQLVDWLIQVRKLSIQDTGNKKLKISDKQIASLAVKANKMRKEHNLKMIELRRKQEKAKKTIVSFVRRWRFRRAVNALIAAKKKVHPKKMNLSIKEKLNIALKIKIQRERIAQQQRQREICARVLQRYLRCRRFRKTIEAIVAINRKHRKTDKTSQLNHKLRVLEAKDYMKKLNKERLEKQKKEKWAIALLQSYIRRRNFRRVIEAIIYQIRLRKGTIKPTKNKKVPHGFLVQKRVDEWSRQQNKVDSQKVKLLKAVKLVQSWYRRRKFRKLVEAVMQIQRATKATKGKKGGKFIDVAKEAKLLVQKNNKAEIAHRAKMLKAVKCVQRWFRRNRFRQTVFAMIVRIKVQQKKLTGDALKKFSKQTLDRLQKADDEQKKYVQQNQKEQKAVKMLQRFFRMRRWKRAILECVHAARAISVDWVKQRHFLSQKEKLLFDERIIMKANFLRKQRLQKEAVERTKLKNAIKLLQSWWRRRKFRKVVNEMMRQKSQNNKVKKGVTATKSTPLGERAIIKSFVSTTPQAQKLHNVSRNATTPQSYKTKSFQDQVHRSKPIDQTTHLQTLNQMPQSKKIVIDYWQDGMKVEFQQAFTQKKPMVMVNLVIDAQVVDRKVIPIDLYHCALDAGQFDLQSFCDQSLMPCIQIKEKNGKYSLEILDELVQEFLQKNTAFDQRPFTASSFARSEQIAHGMPKLLNKKLTGMMPLVKRSAVFNNQEFIVQAICDFDMQLIKLTAEREDAYIFLNVQMSQSIAPSTAENLPALCAYATDLTHQLQITNDELHLRKAVPYLHDEEVFIRTSATLKDRFYLISIGHQHENLIVEALDKAREVRLWLRLGKSNYAEEGIGQEEADNIVAKLDTGTDGNGETILVLK